MVIAPPMAIVAELTHRCPLQCPYCANPLTLTRAAGELDTETWCAVLAQAAALGVLHIHFSGGEPLARRDITTLVAHAAALELYTNLITSGIGLDEARAAELAAAGLDHVQLSFQDSDPAENDRMAGYPGSFAKKLTAAAATLRANLPLTANFVVTRANTSRVADMIALGVSLGATRIEIAHVQYHGWALENRASLLPDQAGFDAATAAVTTARETLSGRVVIDYVVPDYFASQPKACMGGWGRRLITITPAGLALPCHAAESLPGMVFPSVRETTLADIWTASPAFNRFRGTGWMAAPCRTCPERETDWGGCRCQAMALLGDATATDPVCALSPHHAIMAQLRETPATDALHYRRMTAKK